MARAFIVLARNDIADNLLQVLDLKPNSSQFSPAYDGQDSGQTGYQTWYAGDAAINTTVVFAVPGVGDLAMDGDSYGLAAYLAANVEDSAGGSLTAAMANDTRTAIFALVAAGSAVDLTAIDAELITAGATAGTGLTTGASTGSVEAVLRILAGEVYKVADGLLVQDAAVFNPNQGSFVRTPNIENPANVEGAYGMVRGRKFNAPIPYLRPGEVRAGQAPVQTGTQDLLFRHVRTIVETGDLHLSALSGALETLKAPTYSFLNPEFTYGAAGTALTLDGTNILATGAAAAVVVYDNAGNII